MGQWIKQFKDNLERQARSYIIKEKPTNVFFQSEEQACFQRKMQQLQDRKAQVIHAAAEEQILKESMVENRREVEYAVRYKLVIQQKDEHYTEEIIQRRKSVFNNDKLVNDYILDDERHLNAPGRGQNVL